MEIKFLEYSFTSEISETRINVLNTLNTTS